MAQTKKMISMSYGSCTSCWKPWRWVRFELILTVGDININSNLNSVIKFTSGSRSTEFKDISPPPMEHLTNNHKDHPNHRKNSHKLCVETDILFWVYWKVNGNWDNSIVRISQWSKSHCRTNTSVWWNE